MEFSIKRIPFEISMDVPNAETLAAMQEVEEMKKNPSLGKAYTDVDQMMTELLSDEGTSEYFF